MTPTLTLCPASPLDDPGTVGMLIALIKLCLQLPGSVNPTYHDDVGALLQPLVVAERKALGQNEAALPDWAAAFDEAARESDYDCQVWLGKNLSRVPRNLLPMYEAVLSSLHALRETMPFEQHANVRVLSEAFALDEVETRLLELAAQAEHASFGFRYLSIERPISKVYRALAAALDVPADRVAQALRWDGRLARSGMLETAFDGDETLRDILDLSDFGKRVFVKPVTNAEDLFATILERLPPVADPESLQWPSLAAEQRVVQAILDTALSRREPGINILLHGAPGTGKTEFAKHLACALGRTAYEVVYRNADGSEALRAQRLASLHTAQCALGRSHAALFVLDEAEDIFQNDHADEDNNRPRMRSGGKAWMNRFLESNPHPVIWITNSIGGMDPAFLRRFTFCVHFDTPNAKVRRQIAQRHLQVLGVSAPVIDAIAQRKEFSAALVSASARAVRLSAGKAGTQDEVAMCHLNSHAKTMHRGPVGPVRQWATRFDPAYLQIDGQFSARQVMDAIVRRGAGAVLMSGPPGTGKTQLAGAIAERLGRELLTYTAADINRKWFGESEQQAARMFTRCDPTRQVLFLDEAEILLGTREDAVNRGAEAVTAEFLRHLEPFPGVFLCATNHGRRIDSALIRRFTFRLEFKPLSLAQREMMLAELLGMPAGQPLAPEAQRALGHLDGLTPGDFANVRKRFDLLGLSPVLADWLAELRQEWSAKPGSRSGMPVGFV